MLKVLKSGFFMTLQDMGRFGYRDRGVPVSGTMDFEAANKANQLLENESDSAVLEITMTGPTLLFEDPSYICLSGAFLSPTLNNEPIENYEVVQVAKGDILSYGRLEKGFRTYLAIKGGFKAPKILGSRSQYHPVTPTKCLKDGSAVEYDETLAFEPAISGLKVEDKLGKDVLEVYKGPEFSILSDAQLGALFGRSFSISEKNNRMAYQLTELIQGHKHSMLTSGTMPGTVQFTPAGRLIILMKDGQTTGGYPRILQLSVESIGLLAQKKFGDSISFKLV
ncbi:biotin-dependent carboxyltransferase family protein [Flagellimonas myxillae]|uniref:5-oxoprolinase subunit C family protein n=1 Tax=Flagellimonas myxillae TaxID=2942214 RepID=UPI00201EEAA5|nr:biotin-dependent carboxyltransferase family protein [Muricauda myxillae]MCL6265784.1 biotin-dependent carboxyltransferase family protein [Muricauda myxillae]